MKLYENYCNIVTELEEIDNVSFSAQNNGRK